MLTTGTVTAPARYAHEWVSGAQATLTWPTSQKDSRDDATVISGDGDPSAPTVGDTVKIKFDNAPDIRTYVRRKNAWFDTLHPCTPVLIEQR
jgi:hypothetical protein